MAASEGPGFGGSWGDGAWKVPLGEAGMMGVSCRARRRSPDGSVFELDYQLPSVRAGFGRFDVRGRAMEFIGQETRSKTSRTSTGPIVLALPTVPATPLISPQQPPRTYPSVEEG